MFVRSHADRERHPAAPDDRRPRQGGFADDDVRHLQKTRRTAPEAAEPPTPAEETPLPASLAEFLAPCVQRVDAAAVRSDGEKAFSGWGDATTSLGIHSTYDSAALYVVAWKLDVRLRSPAKGKSPKAVLDQWAVLMRSSDECVREWCESVEPMKNLYMAASNGHWERRWRPLVVGHHRRPSVLELAGEAPLRRPSNGVKALAALGRSGRWRRWRAPTRRSRPPRPASRRVAPF